MEDKGVGDLFSEEYLSTSICSENDAGRQLLVVQGRQRETNVNGERQERGAAGPGHGAQAGVVYDAESGEQRENWGLGIHGGIRRFGPLLLTRLKGNQGTQKTLRKDMESQWRDGHTNHSNSVPLKTKCDRVVYHVFSTALTVGVYTGRGAWPMTRARN